MAGGNVESVKPGREGTLSQNYGKLDNITLHIQSFLHGYSKSQYLFMHFSFGIKTRQNIHGIWNLQLHVIKQYLKKIIEDGL